MGEADDIGIVTQNGIERLGIKEKTEEIAAISKQYFDFCDGMCCYKLYTKVQNGVEGIYLGNLSFYLLGCNNYNAKYGGTIAADIIASLTDKYRYESPFWEATDIFGKNKEIVSGKDEKFNYVSKMCLPIAIKASAVVIVKFFNAVRTPVSLKEFK